MIDLQATIKDPYDSVIFIIDAWCKENYYSNFLVTLQIDGELRTECLYFDTEDPQWIWERDWFEDETDVKLVGFIDMHDVYVSGVPGHLKFITMEESK